LFFLVQPEKRVETEWVDKFVLDPDQTYYRGEELNRGVIPLDESTSGTRAARQPEVLDKTRQLCKAFSPPRLADKLTALRKLVASGDPVVRKEAQKGLKHLQSIQH
jgi:hypothetical protein